MSSKNPPDAYRGFRSRLPDWLIGIPTARDQGRVVSMLDLKPGDCVCDASCGPGFNLRRLVKAVGPRGLVVAVEESEHLLARAGEKAARSGWANVRLSNRMEAALFEQRPVDGIIVSYNPPIFLQREDLLLSAWELLKPGGRLSLVAGRCTTPTGRMMGPLVRGGLMLLGHGNDWHYWTVHEPWAQLSELCDELTVKPYAGFQYLLLARKAAAAGRSDARG